VGAGGRGEQLDRVQVEDLAEPFQQPEPHGVVVTVEPR